MQERRKGTRTGLGTSVVINRIDELDNEEVKIDIIDLSKSGIGFTSEKALQIGAVYESYLKIWTQERIHAYLQITRIEQKDDLIEYGAFFVGMPEMDSARIANYSIIEKTAREMEEDE
ncbi:MAG: PilZ domain-containing protein [Lachnospiraceae bacterium]|nr:PilZ domain-containing protein [Lachnospiraceae bacterium]